MAIKVALVAVGIAIGVVGGAALGIHAADEGGVSEDQPDASSVVAEAEPAPTPEPAYGIWDKLAVCESTSDWHKNTGNGFFGGIQFDRQTWLAYGGGVYAARADLATRGEQILVAERLRAARGYQPWPACSRKLGLR